MNKTNFRHTKYVLETVIRISRNEKTTIFSISVFLLRLRFMQNRVWFTFWGCQREETGGWWAVSVNLKWDLVWVVVTGGIRTTVMATWGPGPIIGQLSLREGLQSRKKRKDSRLLKPFSSLTLNFLVTRGTLYFFEEECLKRSYFYKNPLIFTLVFCCLSQI